MELKIREKLDELRIHLQNDDGDLEVVSIEGTLVKLRLLGACASCLHSAMTVKSGLERILREEINSEIVIERVT